MKCVFGPDYDVLPSAGNSVHVEPGPKLGEKVRAGARPSGAPVIAPERDIGTAEGRASSREDLFQDLQRRFGSTPEEQDVENKRMARAKEMGSDEYYEKQRKESMYQTLAEIGFNMASSKSPNLLQAIGEAAAAAMPGARADKKERKALKDRALDIMGDINGLKRKENLQLFGMAVELDKEGRQQEQFEQKIGLDERQLDLAERKLNAEIAAAKAGGNSISVDEVLAQQILSGVITPAMAEALLLKRGGADDDPTIADIKARVAAGRAGNTGGTQSPAAPKGFVVD